MSLQLVDDYSDRDPVDISSQEIGSAIFVQLEQRKNLGCGKQR